jgi:hypothetical protein
MRVFSPTFRPNDDFFGKITRLDTAASSASLRSKHSPLPADNSGANARKVQSSFERYGPTAARSGRDRHRLSATFTTAPGGGAWTATDINLCQLGLESA